MSWDGKVRGSGEGCRDLQSQLQGEAGIACVNLSQFLMLWCSAEGSILGKGGGSGLSEPTRQLTGSRQQNWAATAPTVGLTTATPLLTLTFSRPVSQAQGPLNLEKANREVDGGFPLKGRRVTMGQGVPGRVESWFL